MQAAVTAQRTTDANKLRRVKKQLKAKAKREAAKAFDKGKTQGFSSGSAAGYASGSRDGYASGSEDGYEDGLTDGSDELDCSARSRSCSAALRAFCVRRRDIAVLNVMR